VLIGRRGVAGSEQEGAQCCGHGGKDRPDDESNVVATGEGGEPVDASGRQSSGAALGEAGEDGQPKCPAHHDEVFATPEASPA
jgi:hypothetical protein